MDSLNEIRQRKIARYRAMMPPDCEIGPIPEDLTDLGYAACLARIAAIAPPDFALKAGAARRLSDLGLLGHLIMSCARLGETYDIWTRHAQMAGEPVQLVTHLSNPVWTVEFAPLPFLSAATAAFCSEELCAMFFAFAQEVTGHDFADFSIELGHAAQAGTDYAGLLPCPISFGHRRTRIIGPASALDLPQLSRNNETFEHLLRHFQEKDSRLQRFAARPVSLQLYDHLLRHLGTEPRIGLAAQALGTSPRSLVRHLAAEGSSFGEVLDEFRRAYATELLRDTAASPKQIAHALGFASENSLRRAFREWTGQPIGRWRRPPADQRNL